MFKLTDEISKYRLPWLILALMMLTLISIGLYFQYILNYQPCVQCIYVRVAFVGMMIIGLLTALFPHNPAWKLCGSFALLTMTLYGLHHAHELVLIEEIQAAGGFTTCALFANFPDWLKLDEWFPNVFEVRGSCGSNGWYFINMSMAEWSRLILLINATVSLFIIVAQTNKD